MAEKKVELGRIKVKLPGGERAKLFTSDGPARHNQVVELPVDECAGYVAQELAHPTEDAVTDTSGLDPVVYVEDNEPEPTQGG